MTYDQRPLRERLRNAAPVVPPGLSPSQQAEIGRLVRLEQRGTLGSVCAYIGHRHLPGGQSQRIAWVANQHRDDDDDDDGLFDDVFADPEDPA